MFVFVSFFTRVLYQAVSPCDCSLRICVALQPLRLFDLLNVTSVSEQQCWSGHMCDVSSASCSLESLFPSFLSHTFLYRGLVSMPSFLIFARIFPSSPVTTESLTHFCSVLPPPAKAKWHVSSLYPLPHPSAAALCPLTSAPRARQMVLRSFIGCCYLQ